jgi:hypothetical protein
VLCASDSLRGNYEQQTRRRMGLDNTLFIRWAKRVAAQLPYWPWVVTLCLNSSWPKTVTIQLLSCQQNAGQNLEKMIENRLFDSVAQFKYLGLTITRENLIQEEIMWRLNSGNAWYPSVQNFWAFRLLSKILKIGTYIAIILPVVSYECETWSLTWMEEHRPRVFRKRVLRRIFGPKRDEVAGG